MPTYEELARESWWRDETIPPALTLLCSQLRAHYGVSSGALGVRGDNKHLRGYHRSRNWIKNSVYCTNRTYSVSETVGNRTGGDGDWCTGVDMTVPRVELLAACQRLDVAVRAGHLEKITEWYGNTDGDDRVDGYNNIANRVATSDLSHLWHLHMSFDRGLADTDHTDLYEILTGDTMALRDDNDFWVMAWRIEAMLKNRPAVAGGPTVGERNEMHYAFAAAAVPITPAQLAAVGTAAEAGAEKGVDAALDGATLTTTINIAEPTP